MLKLSQELSAAITPYELVWHKEGTQPVCVPHPLVSLCFQKCTVRTRHLHCPLVLDHILLIACSFPKEKFKSTKCKTHQYFDMTSK